MNNEENNDINLKGSGLIYSAQKRKYEQLSPHQIEKIRGNKY